MQTYGRFRPCSLDLDLANLELLNKEEIILKLKSFVLF